MRVTPISAVLVAASLLFAGCTTDSGKVAGSATPVAGSASAPGSADPSAAEASTPATSQRDDGPSDGFEASSRTERGTSPAGSSWDFLVPQVTGGAAAPRETFNAAMDGAALSLTGPAADSKVTITSTDLGSSDGTRAVVGATTLSGVVVVLTSSDGAAHPTNVVTTAVVDSATGDVITLDSLFTDPAAGRQHLATLAATADQSERLANTTVTASELSEWIALDDGLHLYVPVAHVMGDYVPVTLPWSDLGDLLTPAARSLFAAG